MPSTSDDDGDDVVGDDVWNHATAIELLESHGIVSGVLSWCEDINATDDTACKSRADYDTTCCEYWHVGLHAISAPADKTSRCGSAQMT